MTDNIPHRLSFAVRFDDHFSGRPVADELPVRLAATLQRPARRADGRGSRQSDGSYRFLNAPPGPQRIVWRDAFARTQAGWTRFDPDPELALPLADPAALIAIDLWPAANATPAPGTTGLRGKLTGPDFAGQTIRIARQGSAFDRLSVSDQAGEFLFLPPGRLAPDASGQIPMTIEVRRPDTSLRAVTAASFAIPPQSLSRLIFTLT